jgi:hypothetical protein
MPGDLPASGVEDAFQLICATRGGLKTVYVIGLMGERFDGVAHGVRSREENWRSMGSSLLGGQLE